MCVCVWRGTCVACRGQGGEACARTQHPSVNNYFIIGPITPLLFSHRRDASLEAVCGGFCNRQGDSTGWIFTFLRAFVRSQHNYTLHASVAVRKNFHRLYVFVFSHQSPDDEIVCHSYLSLHSFLLSSFSFPVVSVSLFLFLLVHFCV